MPTNTYTPIAEITLASTDSSITFSSIPQSYRDLVFIIDGTATTNQAAAMRFNGDSGTNYSAIQMYGLGSSTGVYSSGSLNYFRIEAMYTSKTMKKIQIMDYSTTNKHKHGLIRSDWGNGEIDAIAARWANTAAITSIELYIPTYAFSAGTTIALYGIAA